MLLPAITQPIEIQGCIMPFWKLCNLVVWNQPVKGVAKLDYKSKYQLFSLLKNPVNVIDFHKNISLQRCKGNYISIFFIFIEMSTIAGQLICRNIFDESWDILYTVTQAASTSELQNILFPSNTKLWQDFQIKSVQWETMFWILWIYLHQSW